MISLMKNDEKFVEGPFGSNCIVFCGFFVVPWFWKTVWIARFTGRYVLSVDDTVHGVQMDNTVQ